MFKSSAAQLKKPKVLTLSAMYIALYVVLYSVKIPLALESRVTVTFLPVVAAGYLLGPITAMIVGGIGDILGFVFFPAGQYFPGFTVSAMATGFIYGVFLYRANKYILLRCVSSVIVITFFVYILLNTFWLSLLYQKAFSVFLLSRFVKDIVSLPFTIIGTMLCIKLHDRTGITKYYS